MRVLHQTAMANTVDARADTFDVLSYEINASFLNYRVAKNIDAVTTLKIVSKISSSSISLDLLSLNVSSVKVNGAVVSYSYTSPSLHAQLPTLVVGDTFFVEVAYHGSPIEDT